MENEDIKKHGIIRILQLTRTNYPKFFKIYTEQEIKDRLFKNVEGIIIDWYSSTDSGQYNFISKKIYLSKKEENTKEITKQDILDNEDYDYTYMHEILHALFGNLEQNGEDIKYTESTFVFERSEEATEIGRGLSEGLKEWLLGKLYSKKMLEKDLQTENIITISNNYPIESNIALQLEAIYGEDKILEICKDGIEVFRTLFDTDDEALEFLSRIDEIYYYNRNIAHFETLIELLEDVWLDDNEDIDRERIYRHYCFLAEENIELDKLDEFINDTEEMLTDEEFNLNQAIKQVQDTIDKLIVSRYNNGQVQDAVRGYVAIKDIRLTDKVKEDNKATMESIEKNLDNELTNIDSSKKEEI